MEDYYAINQQILKNCYRKIENPEKESANARVATVFNKTCLNIIYIYIYNCISKMQAHFGKLFNATKQCFEFINYINIGHFILMVFTSSRNIN